jgi:hypothetical protein
MPRIKRRSDSLSRTLSFASNGLSQGEILQYELPLTPCKRSTADTANYLAVICLGTSFDFDHLIKGIAVRASKCVEATDTSHDTPPIPALAAREA